MLLKICKIITLVTLRVSPVNYINFEQSLQFADTIEFSPYLETLDDLHLYDYDRNHKT